MPEAEARRDSMPAVDISNSPHNYSRQSSMLVNSKSDSGQLDVLMDINSHMSPDQLITDKPSKPFWRNLLAIVMMPFILTGAPVLSALQPTKTSTIDGNTESIQIDSTNKWLRSIFANSKLLPINVLTVVITLALNSWLLYLTFDIIIKLFILGEVPKHFMDTLYEFLEIIPIILAVDLFWVKGYLLREIILQFDSVSEDTEQKSPTIIYKIIFIYILCFSLHIIGYFTFQWRLQFGYTSESMAEYFEHLPHRVVNTFLIPVYITFGYAIQSKYQEMNGYIKQLTNGSEKPEIIHLRQIKCFFKTNCDLIRRINSTFNLVMSAFFAVILVGVARDSLHTTWSILAYVSFMKALSSGSDDYNMDIMREMVRCISADVLVLLMKFALIGLTVMQIISVNHESRSAPIHLNDLFTQFSQTTELEPVLYRSFRLLKYYMLSRISKTDRSALLNISLLSNLPFIKSKVAVK